MGQSQRELRTRIKSVESTMHITRAMELVSSSKFKKAFDTLEKGKCYFELLDETFADISSYAKDSVFFKKREVKIRTFIVISGDRGLVGGFNNNIYKTVDSLCKDVKQSYIIPFGKKATEHYKSDERTLSFDGFAVCDNISPERIKELVSGISKDFVVGKTDEVYVVYTKYINMLSQEMVYKQILPISNESKKERKGEMMFEPSGESVLSSAVPEYLSGAVYGALCESITAENAARRTAMDSATKNAGEIIDSLTLAYNRARQSAITQEITEIIAGSEN